MFYNDLELPPSTLEQETSREPSAFVMEYGVSHPFGSGSQRVRIENLQLEAMPGYTFVLYAENPDNRPSWSASEAVQRNSSYANWPPFHNGVGNGSGATDENREDGSVPIIWPPAATNFSADVEFDWSRILTESKLDIYFSEEMDPNNFGIGFDFSDDFSIEWADDNKSVTITFENITKSIEGSAYIMRLKDAQGNMIPGPIGSSTDTLPYIPPYELIITTDRNMVNKGEYFNVDASFSEPASTNALSITFSYNPELFRYRGFTPAEGVSLVNTIRDDESGTITFVLARLEGYAWEGIGRVLFSALDDAELPMGRTSIDAGMKYAYKAETGDKYLLSLGASAGLITGRPWTGDPTLIDLSNAIDYFGTSSEDSIWERAMFYDFNSNGEIDISDITYIAVRIRL
ncbi:MAG: hypothetical protein ACOX27_11760 [Caldicoprobacterales bacterium]